MAHVKMNLTLSLFVIREEETILAVVLVVQEGKTSSNYMQTVL